MLEVDGTTGAMTWSYGAPNDKMNQAFEMYAKGKTAADVIALTGVSKSTAYRWMKEFRAGAV
jgi:transposase